MRTLRLLSDKLASQGQRVLDRSEVFTIASKSKSKLHGSHIGSMLGGRFCRSSGPVLGLLISSFLTVLIDCSYSRGSLGALLAGQRKTHMAYPNQSPAAIRTAVSSTVYPGAQKTRFPSQNCLHELFFFVFLHWIWRSLQAELV